MDGALKNSIKRIAKTRRCWRAGGPGCGKNVKRLSAIALLNPSSSCALGPGLCFCVNVVAVSPVLKEIKNAKPRFSGLAEKRSAIRHATLQHVADRSALAEALLQREDPLLSHLAKGTGHEPVRSQRASARRTLREAGSVATGRARLAEAH